MRIPAQITIAVCCCLIAAGVFLLAQREPRPGPGSLLTELAGDWTIRVAPGDYLLGNALDSSGQAVLYRPDRSGVMRAVQKNILAYAAGDQGILLRTNDGYTWLPAGGGEPAVSADVVALPDEAAILRTALRNPAPSYRTRLTVLAALCAAASVCSLLAAAFKRRQRLRNGESQPFG
jgi:hypothetical protein